MTSCQCLCHYYDTCSKTRDMIYGGQLDGLRLLFVCSPALAFVNLFTAEPDLTGGDRPCELDIFKAFDSLNGTGSEVGLV
jgi:hypothetical protein